MTIGLASVIVVYGVGAATGASMDGWVWLVSAAVAWLGSVVFAAFGLFMGYLLPSENVMQILGPGLGLLALAGGLFTGPVTTGWFATFATFMPTYGLNTLAHSALTGDGFTVTAVANVVVWAAVFTAGAVVLFRRDTRRV